MSEGKRPGGLTALAVLNFVFGGLGILGVLALWALYALVSGAVKVASEAAKGTDGAQAAQAVTQAVNTSSAIVLLLLILSLITVILLIVSGVGYLGQKKFTGQRLGTIYAIISIAHTVMNLVLLNSGFGFLTILGLTYPALTLFLLNTTFKEDFVNP